MGIFVRRWLLMVATLWPGLALALEPSEDVVATTPVPGSDVPREQVPANVRVLDREALEDAGTRPLEETLARELPAASTSDTQGNSLNSTLNLRGYTVSPVLGSPQGIAVYQGGQRINDPFGDTVHWSSIPSFAIERAEVTPGASAPFGLNALGGAVALRMKDGFSAPGARITALGQAFGSISGTAEYGVDLDRVSFYGGVSELHDHGWRDASPSDALQVYLDAGARGERTKAALALTVADAKYTGNGASPVELLDDHYRSIFTSPDSTDDVLWNLAGRSSYAFSAETELSGNAYWRHDQLQTKNGDDADYGPCAAGGGTLLCSDPGTDEQVATDASGSPLPASTEISGLLNKTSTQSQAAGASLQLGDHRDVWGLANRLSVGGALDLGWTRYHTHSEAGLLEPSREVDGQGFYLGGDELNTELRSQNRAVGAYFSDVLALTPALSATVAGRLNFARVALSDQLGSELDGHHDWWRFNPSLGLGYRFSPSLDAYASYGEANRTPTAAELSCADPDEPCRVPNAFTADPDLNQVVSRTVELGARGGFGSVRWSAAGYASWNRNDILFVASGSVLGSGYFANAGDTRRLGVEAELVGEWSPVSWFVRYGYVQATFQSNLAIQSPQNPAADANGEIHVHPGDALPNIPQQALKAGLDWTFAEDWRAGVDGVWVSSRPFQGDESNDLAPLPGYAIANAELRYSPRESFSVVLRLENVFDTKFYTSGVLADPGDVFPSFGDQRFSVPGKPRTLTLWLSARF